MKKLLPVHYLVIFLLLFLTFLPEFVGYTNPNYGDQNISCGGIDLLSFKNYSLENKEISIFPEFGNIQCLGKTSDITFVIKSSIFYSSIKFLSLFIIFFTIRRSKKSIFMILGFLSLLISYKFNPNISFWLLLKEFLLLFLFSEFFCNDFKNIKKLDIYAKKLYVIFYIFLGLLILQVDWKILWKYFGVPSLSPKMVDLRAISGATLSYIQGFNPHNFNPGDIKGRLFTHPNIWAEIGQFFNLTNLDNLYFFGTLMILLFIFSNYFLINKFPSIILFFVSVSFPVFFAIERGQNDLIIYFILLLGIVLNYKTAFILFPIATLLKIYPIFSFSVFMKKRISSLLPIFIGLSILLSNLQEINIISKISPKTYWYSFGTGSLNVLFKEFTNTNTIWFIYIFSGIIILFLIRSRTFSSIFSFDLDTKKLPDRLFLLGHSLYIGLFFFTSSYDYKLIFLIYCVPYLVLKKEKQSRNILFLIFLISSEELFNFHFSLNGVILITLFKYLLFIILSIVFINFLKANFANYKNGDRDVLG